MMTTAVPITRGPAALPKTCEIPVNADCNFPSISLSESWRFPRCTRTGTQGPHRVMTTAESSMQCPVWVMATAEPSMQCPVWVKTTAEPSMQCPVWVKTTAGFGTQVSHRIMTTAGFGTQDPYGIMATAEPITPRAAACFFHNAAGRCIGPRSYGYSIV